MCKKTPGGAREPGHTQGTHERTHEHGTHTGHTGAHRLTDHKTNLTTIQTH